MFKLILLPLFFFGTAFAEVELHPAVKEDFYKGNWAYILPNESDYPEKAQFSDIVVNDTTFTTDLKKYCSVCPEDTNASQKPTYAFTNLYETPEFKGTPYKFALLQNNKGVFINPKGKIDTFTAIENIGVRILSVPIIYQENFSAIWYTSEKRFLFAKNPSFYFENKYSSIKLSESTFTSESYLDYRLHEKASFYAEDQKTKLKQLDFSDSYVEILKMNKDGVKIRIRDLSCGRGKSNVIAGVCIKPAYLLDYYNCGEETEAFIKINDLVTKNGEFVLIPSDFDNSLAPDPEFFYVKREDSRPFPQKIKRKIKEGTITEKDITPEYRQTGYGGATNDINILIMRRISSKAYHHKTPPPFSRCDPETGKLQ